MRSNFLATCFVAICLPLAVLAGGFATSYRLNGGVVALTNTQANSSWVPVGVLWKFDAPTNAVVSIERVSLGDTYLLGVVSVMNATCVMWLPEVDYPFALGDVLRVACTTTNGVVQVIRKGE